MKKENYYRLTKKELSFITSIEKPLVSDRFGCRLSRPVVLKVCPRTKEVLSVYTLSWYRTLVEDNTILPFYEYYIRAMY